VIVLISTGIIEAKRGVVLIAAATGPA